MEGNLPNQLAHTPTRGEQAYAVTINTAAFQYKNAPIKERAQRELLPEYWNKFKMDQKTILPSKEDRLSQLTTKQIDRIIDMQKIRSLLYNKKRKLNDHFITFEPKKANFHTNIYQANFLATVNQIAIQRNIQHEASQGFDEFEQSRPNQNKAYKRIITVPYKYSKNYTLRSAPESKHRFNPPQEEPDKSIESIEADLDAFQLNLPEKKLSTIYSCEKKKQKNDESKLLNGRKWFYGMSTIYVEKPKTDHSFHQNELYRAGYDIESELRDGTKDSKKITATRRTSTSLFTSKKNNSSKSKREPFDRFKTNRLVTIS